LGKGKDGGAKKPATFSCGGSKRVVKKTDWPKGWCLILISKGGGCSKEWSDWHPGRVFPWPLWLEKSKTHTKALVGTKRLPNPHFNPRKNKRLKKHLGGKKKIWGGRVMAKSGCRKLQGKRPPRLGETEPQKTVRLVGNKKCGEI